LRRNEATYRRLSTHHPPISHPEQPLTRTTPQVTALQQQQLPIRGTSQAGFARLERLANSGGDLDRLVPAGSGVADAVAQIGAGCAAVRRVLGSAVVTVPAAQLVAACSGGWLLGSAPPAMGGGWINTSPHL
jgi:hypothetical protein